MRNGRPYYYRKLWVGGRVVSIYQGSGELALFAQFNDNHARSLAAADRLAWEAERGRLAEDESRVSRAIRDIDLAVSAAMESAGWHRPSRRLQWLRKHGAKDTNMSHAVAVPRSAVPARCSPEKAREIISLALTAGATSGGIQMGIMDEFRELIRTEPRAAAEAASVLGLDIEAAIAGAIIDGVVEAVRCHIASANSDGVAGGDRDVIRPLVEAKLDAFRDDLAGDDPTPAERHLATAAALAWLDWHRCEAQRHDLPDDTPAAKASYFDRRADRAHARFVRTLKALAAVRKLPAVPIRIVAGVAHVAQQPVNATAPAGAIGARPGLERRRSEEFHPGRPGSKVGSTPG